MTPEFVDGLIGWVITLYSGIFATVAIIYLAVLFFRRLARL